MKNISKALLAVQQELKPVRKDRSGYGYKYADLSSVLDAITELLNKHGVVVLQPTAAGPDGHATVRTILLHAESGEQLDSVISVPFAPQAKLSVAQCFGSALTYARRYALTALLSIPTEDDDGANAGQQVRASKPAASATTIQDVQRWLADCETEAMLKAAWGDTPDSLKAQAQPLFAARKAQLANA